MLSSDPYVTAIPFAHSSIASIPIQEMIPCRSTHSVQSSRTCQVDDRMDSVGIVNSSDYWRCSGRVGGSWDTIEDWLRRHGDSGV